jgi:hypothetical protein
MKAMKSVAGLGLVVLGMVAGCGLMLNYSDYETVAGTSTGTGTGGSGAMGGGGTGGSAAEDCTDGIDNDGDGATDCADVKCADLGYTCAQQPDVGWGSWQGPIIAYDPSAGSGGGGGGTPASCVAGGYPDPWSAYIVDAPPAECTCKCDPSVVDCTSLGPPYPKVSLDVMAYTDSACNSPCAAADHQENLSQGDCVAPAAWPSPCSTSSSIHAWQVKSSMADDTIPATCNLTVVTTNLPPVDWRSVVACRGDLGTGCSTDGAHHCAPPLPDASALLCIYRPYQSGDTDASCPAPYQLGGRTWSSNNAQLNDTRTCGGGSCHCGTITGHCDGFVEVHLASPCSSAPARTFQVISASTAGCFTEVPELFRYIPQTFVPGQECTYIGNPTSDGKVEPSIDPDFLLCCLGSP